MNEHEKLQKAYQSRIKNNSKNIFNTKDSGLNLFVDYLCYLRDTAILNYENTEEYASLMAAIAEYKASKISCENDIKEFHWNNFCELLRLNMQKWLML